MKKRLIQVTETEYQYQERPDLLIQGDYIPYKPPRLPFRIALRRFLRGMWADYRFYATATLKALLLLATELVRGFFRTPPRPTEMV